MKNKYYKQMYQSPFDDKPKLFAVYKWDGKKFVSVYKNEINFSTFNHAESNREDHAPSTKKVFDEFTKKTIREINEVLLPKRQKQF